MVEQPCGHGYIALLACAWISLPVGIGDSAQWARIPPGSPSIESLIPRPREHWIESIADARAIPTDADPSERAILRQSIRLAFVAKISRGSNGPCSC